jgi:F-box/leucine-rich repeat protein 16
MAGMSSISKACLEISNSIRGFRLTRSQSDTAPLAPSTGANGVTNGAKLDLLGSSSGRSAPTAASSVTTTISRAIKSATSRVKAFDRNGQSNSAPPQPPPPTSPPVQAPALMPKARKPLPSVWQDEKFLAKFFFYFSPCERCALAQVCALWRDILYAPVYWSGVMPVLSFKEWSKDEAAKACFFRSLQQRGFDSLCLFGATDTDINDLTTTFLYCRKNVRSLTLRCSNVSDSGLQTLTERMTCVFQLELSGCNEITEAGLWACLNSRIVSLSISDCINVADDSVGAIAQLLPSLYELTLQAYHVTDAALSLFSAKQSYTLSILRLHSCWEITNHGIVNVIHALPNLTVLSLSGCSKITDDGIELIAENLRKLKSLDLSWCPRITDAALEYIACDLGQLEELTLDRCASF